MRKTHLQAFGILAMCLLLVGCPKTDEPAASDTVLGPPTTMRGGDGPDMIGTDGVYTDALGREGLTTRDTDFNALQGGPGGRRAQAIESIYFGFDENSIRPAERAKVDSVVEDMRTNSNLKVICEGHTDWIGTEEYNLGLGDRRANSVKTFMVQLGIDANRIEILSMGELDATPDVHRDSPQARQDRRVDIIPSR